MQPTLLNYNPDACPIKLEIGNDVGEEIAVFNERFGRWVIMGPPLPRHDLQSMKNYSVPQNFALFQNYPNPFNPQTQIAFNLPERCHVVISVYNLTGKLIKILYNAQTDAGKHQVVWNGLDNTGRTVASGIYIYKLTATNEKGKQFNFYKKMMLLR
ncbi:MAG: T9SS type A sorting domain-containing protein [Calditrichaeota bacterium]|nr:T9SS type A sorting domain-containing protein [Calditrichota bacterium]